jgi:hypothetical protein
LEILSTGYAAHRLGYACSFAFGLLQIQTGPGDPAVADAEDRHPAFLQRRPVLLGPLPNPLGPLFVANNRDAEDFGRKVGDAFKQLRPVLPDLVTPGEGSSGMRRLLTSVVVMEAGKLRLEMMGVWASRSLTARAWS